ncbi:MAG TPA: hypothetical protein DHV36_08485 [Desulfobacteraceae bacterium]|nr:hypothetical protein [Desulfobacteraceae bacterium]
MQRVTTALKTKVLVTLTTIAWICGLLAAGSDGPLMPYINVAGGLLFLGASMVLGRLLPRLSEDSTVAAARPLPCINPYPGRPSVRATQPRRTVRNRPAITGLPGQGISPRFARELGVV